VSANPAARPKASTVGGSTALPAPPPPGVPGGAAAIAAAAAALASATCGNGGPQPLGGPAGEWELSTEKPGGAADNPLVRPRAVVGKNRTSPTSTCASGKKFHPSGDAVAVRVSNPGDSSRASWVLCGVERIHWGIREIAHSPGDRAGQVSSTCEDINSA
jgi:hypothetical protein